VVIEIQNTPATAVTWTGTVSTDWNTSENWSVSRVPYDVDNVTIPSGTTFSPHVTAVGATPAECNNITINAASVLTVDATKALTVHNNLVNNAGEDGLVVKSNYLGDSGSGWTNNSGSLIVLGSITGNGTVERAVNSDRWYLLAPPANEKVTDFIARNKNIPYWQINPDDSKLATD
jgi:hypothetical protein